HLHGERRGAGDRRHGRHGQPNRRCHRRVRDDRWHRDPARARLAEARVRPRFRADAIPYAAVRPRYGAADDLEAARAHLLPRALHLPARAPHGARRRGGRGAWMMAAPPVPLLSVEHLTMRFGGLVAIDDLSFSANRGEITAIIGPNGAGKTTVFNCITGFYKPT